MGKPKWLSKNICGEAQKNMDMETITASAENKLRGSSVSSDNLINAVKKLYKIVDVHGCEVKSIEAVSESEVSLLVEEK